VYVGRRDKGHKDKVSAQRNNFVGNITKILDEIQDTLLERARSFRKANTIAIDDNKEFYEFFTPDTPEKPEIHGGFALSHWCGKDQCESKIKEDLSVTIRCIPLDNPSENGKCICCDSPSTERVVFAKAY
jgi:prolyl-tRNA synthetase